MTTIFGIAWLMLAASFLGTFALPAKYIKNYAWENTWGAFFFLGMIVVPVGFASLTVDGLWATYAEASPTILFGVIALGFLWGCGFCSWGKGLSMVGLSLGYSLTMGTMALVGSMLPFFLGHADQASTTGGMIVIGGILICIAGVAINGFSGILREKSQASGEHRDEANHMFKGLLICILAGVLSSGCNVAYHVGGNYGHLAQISQEKFGNAPWLAGLSVWTLIFIGGAIASVGFSVIQLFKHNTWGNFLNEGSLWNLNLATLMAVGHFACLFFYGVGAWKLGTLGTSVGFAIFQSGSLLVGNGLGFLTGEWSGASRSSRNWFFAGLTVLILGIVVVAFGNALISNSG